MNDRALSDVIGYVLVFSLIIATVGVVSTVGFTGLQDRQDAEQINNVERAFDVFDHNVEDVYKRGAPSRATEMRLGGGSLGYGERIEIEIESGGENVTASSTPLVYSRGNTEILYVSGAIIRVDDGNAVMLSEPDFVFETDHVVMPLIETRSRSDRTIGGESTIRVTSEFSFIETTVPAQLAEPSGSDVNVTIESSRAEAWERYFEDQPGSVESDLENDRVRFTVEEKERISAPRFRIRLDFRQ